MRPLIGDGGELSAAEIRIHLMDLQLERLEAESPASS